MGITSDHTQYGGQIGEIVHLASNDEFYIEFPDNEIHKVSRKYIEDEFTPNLTGQITIYSGEFKGRTSITITNDSLDDIESLIFKSLKRFSRKQIDASIFSVKLHNGNDFFPKDTPIASLLPKDGRLELDIIRLDPN